MKPLRAYVLTPAFLPEIGGQEIHIHELSASLIENGLGVVVITRRFDLAHPPSEVVGTVPVLRFTPTGETKGKGWRAVLPLAMFLGKIFHRLLRDHRRYDVILVSGFNILPLVAVLSARLTGRRCVVRPESPMELRYAVGIESQGRMGLPENSLFVRALTWTRRLAALRVDRYIAISAEIRAGLKDSGVDDARIVSIPNGIDIKKFAPVTPDRQQALRERLALPRKARILIYTGRLAVSKGVMMLADVWRDISAEHPDTHLVLVGTGFGSIDSCEAQLLQFVAANGFADRITLPGNVSNVNEYLQASDIFLFPSDYEGFGLSILEAMAVGLPMVSTRVGVAADEVARYQPEFLVEPRRPDEFKQALRRLLGDQARQRAIGERAHGEVQARFSMAAVARRYIEVFADLTNPAPRVAPGISRNADGADLTKQ